MRCLLIMDEPTSALHRTEAEFLNGGDRDSGTDGVCRTLYLASHGGCLRYPTELRSCETGYLGTVLESGTQRPRMFLNSWSGADWKVVFAYDARPNLQVKKCWSRELTVSCRCFIWRAADPSGCVVLVHKGEFWAWAPVGRGTNRTAGNFVFWCRDGHQRPSGLLKAKRFKSAQSLWSS